jgi:hypothetical protein
MKPKTFHSLLAALLSLQVASAITITFEDGLTSPTQPAGIAVGTYYSAQGMVTPNLRFHLGTFPGVVPFNFTDDWGAYVDFGVFGTSTGIIQFTTPVDAVQIDAFAQAAFDLNGTEPYAWSLTAFDSSNNQIGFVSEAFGFDFAGVPNPPNTDPYPLASLSLSLAGIGSISRLEIDSDRKLGIDTIQFDPIAGVPDTAHTAFLLLMGLLGMRFGCFGKCRSNTNSCMETHG